MIDLIKIITAWREILVLIISVLIGYIIRLFEDKRRRTFDMEKEYREELRKYSTEIFEPLFKITSDIIQSLIMLIDWCEGSKKYISNEEALNDTLDELSENVEAFDKFNDENETRIELILPSELSSMIFINIRIKIYEILENIYDGKSPTEKIRNVALTLIDVRSDIQKLLGYSTSIKLQTERML